MKVIIKRFQTVLVFLILSILLSSWNIQAQGCVAIRHFSCGIGNELEANQLQAGDVLLGMNYRYFKSFRHFKGTEEEPDRVANNTEVINYSHSWDFSINYGLTNRLFASITLPLVLNERSSLYEHGREERNKTFSRGLADIRIGAGYWLLDPATHMDGNISLGLGLKLPTGNYNASDIFYNVGPEGSPQVRPVDQSIQPGDGGFGFTTSLQFYQNINSRLFVYGGGFYLFNPRETNGIRTFRETLNPILENESIMSVPDQFSVNTGFGYTVSNSLSASLGVRYEGVPVEDVIGGSEGFRRPGNVISIDPGLSIAYQNILFNLNVPVALRRERPQSVTDRETEIATGNPRNGDAAFADYLINFGISYRIPRKNKVERLESTTDYQIE
ncbi:transporter [Gramella sp. MT6]|uniref:transporter n=1 Tax=Gramella sp. MT6 TaxID=2705471 RepID=UPI00214E6CAA|nr:transporter [Gramella sp. MT6]